MGQSKHNEQNEDPVEGKWEQGGQVCDPLFVTLSWLEQLLHVNLNILSQNPNFPHASSWILTHSIISNDSVFIVSAK